MPPEKVQVSTVLPLHASVLRLQHLVRDACRAHPHLTTRLERAAFLLLLRTTVRLGEDDYEVGSEDGLRNYRILRGHCDCQDYVQHGPGHPCKHRLAIALGHLLMEKNPDVPLALDLVLQHWPDLEARPTR